jgi:hypothetical protein
MKPLTYSDLKLDITNKIELKQQFVNTVLYKENGIKFQESTKKELTNNGLIKAINHNLKYSALTIGMIND